MKSSIYLAAKLQDVVPTFFTVHGISALCKVSQYRPLCYTSDSHSVVSGPAAAAATASLENLIRMQNLRSHYRPTASETKDEVQGDL